MPPILKDRDCLILMRGNTFPVSFDSLMASGGWQGGQGIRYTTPVAPGVPTVTYSDGVGVGFMLFGSDETGDDYTSLTRNQGFYRFGTGCLGGWAMTTVAFESHTYASRVGGGPLVPLTYNESDLLVFSLRGYWTKEDEWTLSGDPRAPNQNYVGSVIQAPVLGPNQRLYLTVQVFL